MRRVGFFRELTHGDADGPSLRSAIDAARGNDDERVGAYLQEANVLAATAMQVDDVLEPANTNITELKLMTDGTWLWPSDLAYYVKSYGVAVPAELLEDIASNAGSPRRLSPRELGELEKEVLG